LSVHEKVLRAFLCEVILKLLKNGQTTGYEIDDVISKKFKIEIGPSVVYTKLSSMERSGLVTCIQHGRVRTYKLTEKGNKALENTPETIREIQRATLVLLG